MASIKDSPYFYLKISYNKNKKIEKISILTVNSNNTLFLKYVNINTNISF